MNIKEQLLHHINADLQQKIDSLQGNILSIRESKNSDTKSSAGDKFETGRAMAQQELDKQEQALGRLIKQAELIRQIKQGKSYQKVAFGSLVKTNTGNYFASINFGRLSLDGEDYYAISLASPIGQVLVEKKVGDKVLFQGKEMKILDIQ